MSLTTEQEIRKLMGEYAKLQAKFTKYTHLRKSLSLKQAAVKKDACLNNMLSSSLPAMEKEVNQEMTKLHQAVKQLNASIKHSHHLE